MTSSCLRRNAAITSSHSRARGVSDPFEIAGQQGLDLRDQTIPVTEQVEGHHGNQSQGGQGPQHRSPRGEGAAQHLPG